jgi:hypothetical protein
MRISSYTKKVGFSKEEASLSSPLQREREKKQAVG